MQIAINPSLYGSAQTYAEQRGLDLTIMIENYLKSIVGNTVVQENKLPDAVANLLGASGGQLAADDLNGRHAYHKHVEEKYR